ncbi:hypothetical protein ABT340_39585 [Streptosporangium sp. NPDC000239]|uniref:hypothetical protein n=1 Tax=Streptosporangium sp. NPDC000239 TaxID=3154248 RepID=UPI00333486D9
MGIASRLQESWYRVTGRTALAEQLGKERRTAEFFQEALTDLEARMYEPGWQHLTARADLEFTREGLGRLAVVCRVMAIKNPLIKRGLALRAAYVWGQGVNISARDEKVNAVVRAFLDDPGNRRVLAGEQAHEILERALGTDGNLVVACFTSPTTGRVKARLVPWDEITDIITNPEDASEPWFYRRDSWIDEVDLRSGARITRRQIVYYPALGYRPKVRIKQITDAAGTGQVMWDAPVYHVKVGGLAGWKWGVPDVYAALDWAAAYREFLTDWAKLVKALSRFAWRLTSKGSKQAQVRARIAAGPSTDRYTGDPQHAGATAIMSPDMALEAVPKSGATIDSDSGRPLAAMVAAALDVPVTMLLGDPGTTGARATAETLDTPTERAMELRRAVWGEMLRQILTHVITESVRAPQGALKGTVAPGDFDGQETVTFAKGLDPTIDISWPDIDDVPIATLIDAITKADSTGYVPPLVTLRVLLEALRIKDVDKILEAVTDEDGNFKPPEGAGGQAGQAAVDAFRRGDDPAALLAGRAPTKQGTDSKGAQPSDDEDVGEKSQPKR